MKLCVIGNSDDGTFLGKEYEEGYYYSEMTNSDGSVDQCWKSLKFFLNVSDINCGLVIFESPEKALEYAKKEWPSKIATIILLTDLEEYHESE